MSQRLEVNWQVAVATAAGFGLLLQAAASIGWRLAVDAPLLAYVAMAIDRFGLVPYRDLFDFNAPGAYLANIAIGRAFGYSDAGFRAADLTCLSALLILTALALRRFGWRTATIASLSFGSLYLGYGPAMSLQREYLLLLPVSAALLVAFEQRRSPGARAFLIGGLIGVATTIKPQSAALLPVFSAWLLWVDRQPLALNRPALSIAMLAAVGFGIPIALVGTWLVATGGLDAFVEIAVNYWPLYNELTGARPHPIVHGTERVSYLATRFFLSRDLRHLVVVPAVVAGCATLLSIDRDEQRQKTVLLVAVLIACQLWPLTAGKFWGYHWLPALYASSLLSGLCFADQVGSKVRAIAPAMLVVLITAQTPGWLQLFHQSRADVVMGTWTTADRIADELRSRARPGDQVQPLDWTGGAVHALLLTSARTATPFLYDFHFYHHVSTPYIRSLRVRLISGLEAGRPAFIVRADLSERIAGPETEPAFQALEDLLRREYDVVVADPRFVLYERWDHHASPRPRS